MRMFNDQPFLASSSKVVFSREGATYGRLTPSTSRSSRYEKNMEY